MSIADLLTWEQIHYWAENTDSTQDIGIASSCSSCPIAHYLRATTGNFRWSIHASLDSVFYAISGRKGEKTIREETILPDWLQRVVEQVDNTIGPTPISKRVFLSILEDCKPEAS
jgi:hypothetical protein